MKELVSKTRARQTLKREKRSTQMASRKRHWKDRPSVRLLPVFSLWAVTLAILHFEAMLGLSPAPQSFPVMAGNAVFLMAGLFATGLFLKIVRPRLLDNPGSVLLLTAIALLSIVSAKLLLYTGDTLPGFPPDVAAFSLPFVLAPMLAATLLSAPAAVAVGGWSGLAMSMAASPERRFAIFATAVAVAIVVALFSRGIRKRAQALKIGFLAGSFGVLCLLALTTLNWPHADPSIHGFLAQILACLASGFVCAVATLLLLPLFEALFNITSDISLLELSDLGHPLLQRLALEAPGSYHHSLVAALLAQAAADEIGANSLLARTAMYFHDIGKLTKPDFFTENIMHKSNPHDDIPPSMSALVIIAHVKEGISLALLHKLPESIRRILREHHGTSLISYFHYKAKSQLELGLEGKENGNGKSYVNENDFRYPGPKPSSRESALVCLADAVEAASRSMEKTTPANIEGLVNDIVAMRIEDGQLDESDLTLSEIAKIKRSFVFSLANMLHGRTPYPKDETRDKPSAKPAAAKPDKDPGPASATGPTP